MAKKNDGKDFEEAIYRFVRALGPEAKVRFDHKTPDGHTGTPRQCDVWVEGRFQGHFPLKYLISCKDKNRLLNIEDVSAFKGQIDSVGASSGALYSRKGFTQPALTKATALGIACCRLYTNQPADIPQVLLFRAYTSSTAIRLHVKRAHELHPQLQTWDDLFALPTKDAESGKGETILESLASAYRDGEQAALADREKQHLLFPANFAKIIEFPGKQASISIFAEWKKYRGALNAHMVNGSFSLTDGHFAGNQYSPAIDTWGPEPGPGWEKLPDDASPSADEGVLIMILHGANIQEILDVHFSDKTLPEDAL